MPRGAALALRVLGSSSAGSTRTLPAVSARLRTTFVSALTAAAVLVLAACAGARGGISPSPDAAAACRWPVAPVVLRQAADTLYQSWTYPAGQLPEAVAPSRLPALSAFLDTVRARVGPLDARAQLTRQIAYYAARPDPDSQGEAENGRLVLAGGVGTLRPASCLEALLVDYQAARFAMASHPTEFHAIVLERGDAASREVRVWFAASGAPWPPRAALLFERVAADRREGWRAVAHIHNHPFLFAGEGDVAGANAPSLTDVQFWRHLRDALGVESARVTNGFATFEAPASSFDRLRARESR